MANKIYALVDCNNFYASCERVFDVNLEKRPIAVLSNNDGIIISRSNEAKALGIPMGAPVYQWLDLIKKENVALFSANFPLYGDMSHRVMQILGQMVPELEIYSIDEAFLDMTNMQLSDVTEYARELKRMIRQWTGIPVSVGIAPTKTLAKAASKIAKKNPEFNGVYSFLDKSPAEADSILQKLDVGDVWGVGRRYATFLKQYHIDNACDLKHADKNFLKKNLTVAGERLWLELNNVSCISMRTSPVSKKSIACTRSFGKYQKTLTELEEAVAYFTRKVSEELRKQRSLTTYLQVFVLTNMHHQCQSQYHNSILIKLNEPTDFTPSLLKAALAGLKSIYKQGYFYKKAGVIALGIIPKDHKQFDFFTDNSESRIMAENKLMQTVDRVNIKVGEDTIKYAVEGTARGWWMQQTQRSQRYTTNWQELLKVRAE